MLVLNFLALCISLWILIVGSNLLVKVATNLAQNFKLSDSFIGVSFLAWATSLPEIVVSIGTAWTGSTDAAMGNLLGSNICNSLLVVGFCSLLVSSGEKVYLKDFGLSPYGLILIGTGLFTWWFYQSNKYWNPTNIQNLIFISLYVLYFGINFWEMLYKTEEKQILESKTSITSKIKSIIKYLLRSFLGCILIVLGGDLSVKTIKAMAKVIATEYGYSSAEKLIGLTVLALGTSLPELVTSIVATFHGKPTMALSNILGSNILNKFGIFPIVGMISPVIVRDTYLVLYTILSDVIVPILCILLWGRKFFTKILGVLLLLLYGLYLLQCITGSLGLIKYL